MVKEVSSSKIILLKRRTFFLIMIFLSAGFFVGGILTYKTDSYRKIPGAGLFLSMLREAPHFYDAPEQGNSEIFAQKDVEYPFTFFVYGDSREPAIPEKDVLYERIRKERPSFIIHTGDLVNYGNKHQWKIFDLFEGPIINSGIPFYPVLGNHEYWTIKKKSMGSNTYEQLQLYSSRFPKLKGNRWYSFQYGNSLFLFLDSNTDYSPGTPQYIWLMEKLSEPFDGFLFITFHHPPYTKNVKYSKRKAEKFLANIFENYKEKKLNKPDIIFSGHVHNYERYLYNGINFVVSGGGGSEPYTIKRDKDDFYNKPGITTHYCKITVTKTDMNFTMIKLDNDGIKWVAEDTFSIERL